MLCHATLPSQSWAASTPSWPLSLVSSPSFMPALKWEHRPGEIFLVDLRCRTHSPNTPQYHCASVLCDEERCTGRRAGWSPRRRGRAGNSTRRTRTWANLLALLGNTGWLGWRWGQFPQLAMKCAQGKLWHLAHKETSVTATSWQRSYGHLSGPSSRRAKASAVLRGTMAKGSCKT